MAYGTVNVGQAQTDDLLAPADKTVNIATRHAEHIQAANRNLDQ